MSQEQERLELELKAAAYDRILEKYLELQENADFYSKNWVELSQRIEQEKARLDFTLARE